MKYFEGKDFEGMFSVPGTDVEYEMATGLVEKVAGLNVPVFEAKISKKFWELKITSMHSVRG